VCQLCASNSVQDPVSGSCESGSGKVLCIRGALREELSEQRAA